MSVISNRGTDMGDNWLDWIEDEANKRRLEAERLDADPVYQARMANKRREDFERGVRLGWWTAEGDPIPQDEETDDDDQEGNDDV